MKKFITLLFVFSFANVAYATDGTIEPAFHTAQLCENVGCTVTSTSPVNFGYFSYTPGSNIIVSDASLSGYMWGSSMGYVVLNCNQTASGCSPINGNFKVINTNGFLSGYAWGDVAGWVNFGPFLNSSAPRIYINSIGELNGYAWAQNFGWIKFDCTDPSYCVKTNYRRPVVTGGGGVIIPPINPNPIINPNPVVPPQPKIVPDKKVYPKTPPSTEVTIPINEGEGPIPVFDFSDLDNNQTSPVVDETQNSVPSSKYNFFKDLRINNFFVKSNYNFLDSMLFVQNKNKFFSDVLLIDVIISILVWLVSAGLVFWLILKNSPYSKIVYKETGKPVEKSFISVISTTDGETKYKKYTDGKGRYRCFLPGGMYTIKVEQQDQYGSWRTVHTSEPIKFAFGFAKNLTQI